MKEARAQGNGSFKSPNIRNRSETGIPFDRGAGIRSNFETGSACDLANG
jgi:hypothetical protein